MGRWILTGGVAAGGVLAALAVTAFGHDVAAAPGFDAGAEAAERVAFHRAVDDCYQTTSQVALRACLTGAMDAHLQSMRDDASQGARPLLLSGAAERAAAARTDL